MASPPRENAIGMRVIDRKVGGKRVPEPKARPTAGRRDASHLVGHLTAPLHRPGFAPPAAPPKGPAPLPAIPVAGWEPNAGPSYADEPLRPPARDINAVAVVRQLEATRAGHNARVRRILSAEEEREMQRKRAVDGAGSSGMVYRLLEVHAYERGLVRERVLEEVIAGEVRLANAVKSAGVRSIAALADYFSPFLPSAGGRAAHTLAAAIVDGGGAAAGAADDVLAQKARATGGAAALRTNQRRWAAASGLQPGTGTQEGRGEG
jgi:hypothetical protein